MIPAFPVFNKYGYGQPYASLCIHLTGMNI